MRLLCVRVKTIDTIMATLLTTSIGILIAGGAIALAVALAAAALWVALRNRRAVRTLCAGTNGAALEEVIMRANEKIIAFDNDIQELFSISNTINKHAHKGLHRVGVVRFNPFRDHSGNQSFAVALLNSGNNGIVLSSIHTREGTRVYTKEIKKGAPVNNELTNEEKQAILSAR